jgi:hypothetical protein
MILTQSELISSLQSEVRILLHLATKVDVNKLDYRPTPKQRSTLELLRYLSVMGPRLTEDAKAGGFNPAAWTVAQAAADSRDFDATLVAIAEHSGEYASLIGDMTDDDFRVDIEMFGRTSSRGAFIVNSVLCGHAAYRTQLFVYLKACGRSELSTMNLWAGIDPTPAA